MMCGLLILALAIGVVVLRPKYFLFQFDYRLSVINGILIYALIAIQFEVDTINALDRNKSTMAFREIVMEIQNNNNKNTTTTKPLPLKSTKMSIIPLNRTASAIFMSDDDAAAAVDPIRLLDMKSNSIKTEANLTNVEVNVDVNKFQIVKGRTYKRNPKHEIVNDARLLQRTLLLTGAIVKRKRWIRDLLTTTAKPPTELTTTTPATGTTMSKIMPKAFSLSNGTQNNSLIIPKISAASVTKSVSSNINDSLQQQPQHPSKRCQQQEYCKESRILSRSKRFLTFPEGSSFSVAVCITVGVVGNPYYSYLAYGLNWGVAYDLPNASWVINHLHGFSHHPVPATVLRRRSRRALYEEIEAVVDNMGYNGRDCVLRALCESRQYFRKNKLSMVGEMLRVVFSLPKQRLFTRELHENAGIELYDHAFRRKRNVDCSEEYDCSFSLLELAFGKYSSPPPGYYS